MSNVVPLDPKSQDLVDRANAYIAEMSKTNSLSFIGDDGYLSVRHPNGVIERKSDKPVTLPTQNHE
jgi:hypothetical protein